MLGGPEATVVSPVLHSCVRLDLTRISNACGLFEELFGVFLSFISNMCIPQLENLAVCIEKKEKTKETLICMEDISEERRMFSHWQILSSCVSNETEANGSLVYFFVSTLTLLMSAKNVDLFFGEGHVFLFHLA